MNIRFVLSSPVFYAGDSFFTLKLAFWVRQVNGQVKQNGNTSDMIFKIPALIEHVSSIMSLEVGLPLSYFQFFITRSPFSPPPGRRDVLRVAD